VLEGALACDLKSGERSAPVLYRECEEFLRKH